jgi:hypothetical protein
MAEETLADFMRFQPSSLYSIRLLGAAGEAGVMLIYGADRPERHPVSGEAGEQRMMSATQPAARPWDAPRQELFAPA